MDFVVGVTLYAIQMFNPLQCDIALKLDAPAISVLWAHFGRDNTCLRRFMPQVRTVQIHHSFHATRAARALRHKRTIYAFTREFPEVMFLVSLSLEDRFKESEAKRAAAAFRRGKPKNVALVRNSLSCPSCRNRGVKYRESHAGAPTSGFQIASNDGYGIAFRGHRDARHEKTLAEISRIAWDSKGLSYYFIWWGEAQGIAKPADRKVPARKRQIKIDLRQVREINGAWQQMMN